MVNLKLGNKMWKANWSIQHRHTGESPTGRLTEFTYELRTHMNSGGHEFGDPDFLFVPLSFHVDQFTFHKK